MVSEFEIHPSMWIPCTDHWSTVWRLLYPRSCSKRKFLVHQSHRALPIDKACCRLGEFESLWGIVVYFSSNSLLSLCFSSSSFFYIFMCNSIKLLLSLNLDVYFQLEQFPTKILWVRQFKEGGCFKSRVRILEFSLVKLMRSEGERSQGGRIKWNNKCNTFISIKFSSNEF